VRDVRCIPFPRPRFSAGEGQARTSKSERYSEKVDVLLVYSELLRFNTIDEKTEDVVVPVILEAVGNSSLPFAKLIILDHGAYVEYRP
jgi:hypothetical protein